MPGEPIKTCMNRFQHIIGNLYKKDHDLPNIIERYCKETVKRLAYPEAREQLDRYEAMAKSQGNEYSYNDRLKLIHREEKLVNKRG